MRKREQELEETRAKHISAEETAYMKAYQHIYEEKKHISFSEHIAMLGAKGTVVVKPRIYG
jgi:hypothetical protein